MSSAEANAANGTPAVAPKSRLSIDMSRNMGIAYLHIRPKSQHFLHGDDEVADAEDTMEREVVIDASQNLANLHMSEGGGNVVHHNFASISPPAVRQAEEQLASEVARLRETAVTGEIVVASVAAVAPQQQSQEQQGVGMGNQTRCDAPQPVHAMLPESRPSMHFDVNHGDDIASQQQRGGVAVGGGAAVAPQQQSQEQQGVGMGNLDEV